jgi:HNH endonuclease
MVAPTIHRTSIERPLRSDCGWGFPQALLRRLAGSSHPAPRPRTCRNPFCGAPIRHLDHITRHTDGGTTSYSNGRGTCERCNYTREMPGWQISVIDAEHLDKPHTMIITTPTGHHYLSRAPDPP